jgi:hypothetical protein
MRMSTSYDLLANPDALFSADSTAFTNAGFKVGAERKSDGHVLVSLTSAMTEDNLLASLNGLFKKQEAIVKPKPAKPKGKRSDIEFRSSIAIPEAGPGSSKTPPRRTYMHRSQRNAVAYV